MKLKEITFESTPRIPGMRAGDLQTISCDTPLDALRGWHLEIKGASVFLVSPPGYKKGQPRNAETEVSGECVVVEVPRINCYLHWQGHMKDMGKVANYVSEPFGYKPPEPDAAPATGSLLAQLDPSQVGDE